MRHPHKLLFVSNLCAAFLALGVISAQGQPTPRLRGVEVRPPLPTTVESPPQPSSYELRCRGGFDAASFESPIPQRQTPGGETIVVVNFNFTAGPRAAGTDSSGLTPGACSWIDRAVNGGEPTQIRFETVDNAQLKQRLSGTAVDTSPTAAESYPDAITIPKYLGNPEHYWSFFVQNANQGYFNTLSHRPWKLSVTDTVIVKPGQLTRAPTGSLATGRRGGSMIEGSVGTVSGRIRWKKEYGLIPMHPGSGDPYPVQCGLFVVKAVATVGQPGDFGRPEQVGSGTGSGNAVSESGYYVCSYTISNLPSGNLLIAAELLDSRQWSTQQWIGGGESQPPTGYTRVFVGGRSVALNRNQSSADVDFEIVYSPAASNPR